MKCLLFILLGAGAAIIFISSLVYLARYGAFTPIRVALVASGGETAVLEQVIGPYTQCGKAMDRVYYKLKDSCGIETTLGVGIYYDNPRKVDKEKLRSEAGCILKTADIARKEGIVGRFTVRELAKTRYAQVEFPYRGKLSVMFGMMKVYPELARFVAKNGFSEDAPLTEIYDIPNMKIVYRKEVAAR